MLAMNLKGGDIIEHPRHGKVTVTRTAPCSRGCFVVEFQTASGSLVRNRFPAEENLELR